jgi:hypothetical protein
MPEPILNSEELARRILGHERQPEYGRFLQGEVRPLLRKFNCPKTGTSTRARWAIDEEMARRVAAALGKTLR